jgi:hypothetical protein
MNLICFPIYAITFRACVGNIDHIERKEYRLRHIFSINFSIQNQAQLIINNVTHLHITVRLTILKIGAGASFTAYIHGAIEGK